MVAHVDPQHYASNAVARWIGLTPTDTRVDNSPMRLVTCCRAVHAYCDVPMDIKTATEQDWPRVYSFYAAIMAEGKTYAFGEGQTLDEVRPWWMEQPPGQTVALDGDAVLGSAKMGANRPGRGAHVATASVLVDPAHQRKGVGRALGLYVLDWARLAGFKSIQFNAVVELNAPAVRLWQSLGFDILGTAPESFNHPEHGLVGLHIMFRHL